MSSDKEIYEALQAVNARLDETGEQLLVDLVEKIRTVLRAEQIRPVGGAQGIVDATLKRWVEYDAAEKPERQAEYDAAGLPSGEGGYLPEGGGFLVGRQGGKIL